MISLRLKQQQAFCEHWARRLLSLTAACFILAAVLSASCPSALADPLSKRLLLNSKELINKGINTARIAPHRSTFTSSFSDIKPDVAQQFELFYDNQRPLVSSNRSTIYNKYFNSWADSDDFDADRSRIFAQHLLLYQGSKTLEDLIQGSDLARFYDYTTTKIKKYKNYTTLSLARKRTGSLGIRNGENRARSIMKFSFHISAHRGLEPHLSIFDALNLRYDVLNQISMLEYRVNF